MKYKITKLKMDPRQDWPRFYAWVFSHNKWMAAAIMMHVVRDLRYHEAFERPQFVTFAQWARKCFEKF